MSNVPTNLIPTRITGLPEYTGTSTLGYIPYILDGRTYKVQFGQIAAVGAVPSTRVIAAGTGLTGGGDLSENRVISIAPGGVGFDQLAVSGATAGTYGNSGNIPVVTVDSKGRVTNVETVPLVANGYVPTSRLVSAGAGLLGGGSLTDNITLSVNFYASAPQALGSATPGVSNAAARGDHVHPAVDLSDANQTQGALPLGRGGTGDALSPVAGAVVYSTGTKFALADPGIPGQVLTSAGTGEPYWQTIEGTGTVTGVSVIAANGFAGTVANPNTLPAITLSTTVTGLVKGNGTALSAAVAGTDYVAPGAITGSGLTMATDRLLGRTTALTGAVEQITVGSGLSLSAGVLSSTVGGTVTSVAASGGSTGLTFSGSPITTSGTLTLGGTLAVASGGTGATTAAGARTNLGAAASGANSDITSLSGITGSISTVDSITFDTATNTTPVAGETGWNIDFGTTTRGLGNGTIILDGMDLVAYCANAEATTLARGEVVYISGSTGSRATVRRAANTSDNTSAMTIGFVKDPIAAGASGYIVTQGVVDKLNLGAYASGDIIYLGATPGTFTNVQPYAPNHVVVLGVVERANAGNGQIYVKVNNGWELNELHNVSAQTPSNGQVIIYNASTSLWQAANLTAGTNVSITNGPGSITINASDQFTGTVTSVAASGGSTGLTFSGSPITTSGTLTLGGTLAVASGGTGATSAATARTNLGAAKSGANTDITSIALTTGTITTAPTAGTDIANKAYVDTISAGINFHQAVRLASAAALPAYTYNNGSSGVGATITANANGALTLDGVAAATNDRVLIKNETSGNAPYNGVYVVTQTGSGAAPFILTRASDFNTAGTGVNQIDAGDFFLVTAGSTQANTSWVQQTPLPITVGTTALVFTQFGAPITYSAGTGLTLAGTVFSIANTGVTATSYGSASAVPVIAVNAQGQITSASNTSIAISGSQVTSGSVAVAQGGTGATTASGARTNLGATTVGGNFFTLANPSAITFIRVNADNTVSTLNAADFRTAIGAGTGGGSVTSVDASGGTTGLTFSGGPITTSGTLTLAGTLAVANGGTGTSTAFTAGSVVFAGASGVYTQDNANLFWDNSNDRLGIGTSAPAARVHVVNSTLNAQLRLQDVTTDATNKFGVIGTGHFTNAQSPVLAMGVSSLSASSTVFIGGGFGTLNAATAIQFYTAANNTTLTGTERMRIANNGDVLVGKTTTSVGVDGVQLLAGGFSGFSAPGTTALFLNRNTNDGTILEFGRNGVSAATMGLASSALTFGTAGSERMRITTAGLVGIGTSAPGYLLHGVQNGNAEFRVSATNVGTNSAGLTVENEGNRNWNLWANRSTDNFIIGANGRANDFLVINGSSGAMTLNVGGVSSTHQFLYNENGAEIQLSDATGNGLILIDNSGGLARFYKVGSGAISMGTTGANYFQFITSSTERMRIDGSGNVGIGTATPAYTLDLTGTQRISKSGVGYEAAMLRFETLSETGAIYRLGMATGGSFAIGRADTSTTNITLDSSGNVGIGTSSPSSRLTVQGDELIIPAAGWTSGQAARLYLGDTNNGIQNVNGAYQNYFAFNGHSWLISGSERMRIDPSGNVGIGTSTPGYRLDVSGVINTNAAVRMTPTNVGAFTRAQLQSAYNLDGTGASVFTWNYTNGGGELDLFINRNGGGTGGLKIYDFPNTSGNPTNIFTVEGGGNVGIGTASPATSLSVVTNTTSHIGMRVTNNSTTQFAGSGLQMLGPSAAGTQGGAAIYYYNTTVGGTQGGMAMAQLDSNGSFQRNLAYYDFSGQSWGFATNSTERMRIDSSGNVGIGTSSPAGRLDVVSTSAGGASFMRVANGSGAANSYAAISLDPGNNGFNTRDAQIRAINNGSNQISLTFLTANAGTPFEAMRIDNVGNLSIGNPWGTARLRVSTSANVNAPVLGNVSNYSAFFSNTDAGYGLGVGTNAVDGHVWLQAQRADSAVAYNITLNEAGGNVGIGTSVPGQTLQVVNAGNYQFRLGAGGPFNYDIGRNGSDGLLYFYGNQASFTGYVFSGANGERMRINSSGEVLIGTTSGGRTVCINAADNWMRMSNPSRSWLIGPSIGSNFNIWDETGGANRFYIDNGGTAYFTGLLTGRNCASTDVNSANDTGSFSVRGSTTTVAAMSFHRVGAFAINMGLGTDAVFRIGGWSASSNCFQMDASGNLTMLGNVTAYSDARIKKDVETIGSALDLVSKMRGVRYTRIDSGKRGVGVIAQEMLEVLPEVVQQGVGDDDTLSVAYGNLVGVLIEAIKELRAEIVELKGK